MTTEIAPPRLTALLPNYNHGAFIGRAIAALLAQTRPPDEIVIVDDASTDNSVQAIENIIALQGSRIRLIRHSENQGAIAALNRGLREALGTYVYFGSADDVTHPNLFETMLTLLERHPAAALACGETRLVDLAGRQIGLRPAVLPLWKGGFIRPEETRKLLATTDHWILTGAAVFRRRPLIEAGGFDAKFGSFADGYAVRRLALLDGFCFAREVVADWRIDPGGYSRSSAGNPEASLQLIQLARQSMAADSVFPDWYPDLFERRWRFAVSRLALEAEPANVAVLEKVGARNGFDRFCIFALLRLRPRALSRLAALAWLTFRYRPVSLVHLATTQLARLCQRRRLGGHRLPVLF